MKRLSLAQWIKANRREIDQCIRRVCDNCRIDDAERKLWVLNDEGLYNWARHDGARV